MKTWRELIEDAFAEKIVPLNQHILSGGCPDHAAYLALVAERLAFIEGQKLAIHAIQQEEEEDDE